MVYFAHVTQVFTKFSRECAENAQMGQFGMETCVDRTNHASQVTLTIT